MSNRPTLEKPSSSFLLSGVLLRIIEKFSKSSVSAEGVEYLNANPTLFVVNHFTRMETALLPQALYKFNGQMVHSLADSSLFVGKFGSILESVGALPLNLPGRDEKIISELMRGTYNWVIYPEGSMVKTKKVVDKGRLFMQTPDTSRAPHTGAAILALKTFLKKEDYKKAISDNNEDLISYYQETYNLHGPADLSPLDLCIVPVNISYYPLRPGKNLLSSGAQLFFKDLSDSVMEELLVEGNIILEECDISISFGRAIELRRFTKPYRRFISLFSFLLSPDQRMNILMNVMCHRLTNQFMQRVYTSLSINMDHLVATALRFVPDNGIKESDFKKAIYLAIVHIKKNKQRRIHHSLAEGVINLVSGESYKPYELIMQLVLQENAAKIENGLILVDHSKIKIPRPFHRMRIESTVSVLANEFEVMTKYVKHIQKLIATSPKKLSLQVASLVLKTDCSLFENERMRSFDRLYTKKRVIGRPQYLTGKSDKPGILLIHGFLSSPKEMEALGKLFHKLGYGVYLVRLSGHGTLSKEMRNCTVKGWLEAVNRGYAVLSHYHQKVLVAGFSAGALLALIKSCANVDNIMGVVAINPALTLKQKSVLFTPLLDNWNNMLNSFSIETGTVKWVDNDPEYPDSNYDRIYISGLRQLLALQESCREQLDKVTLPLLVIQSENDPTVDFSSAEDIIDKVLSADKELCVVDANCHVIVRGDKIEEVYQSILTFIEKVN
ncbi:glycerol acyltransferase [Psychromonas sp. RZ22]|uniref:alpha/beta fold hydrolase n=1 Tax=Psychromonas algarum TaxID=2555643 RepID=UPI0010688CC2|nr:alpha/beta fold hydrolase [Psychromonas sp. RZ22]TEW54170.1 glycerol acyltransferase [Psychromonas sp. RZ22]